MEFHVLGLSPDQFRPLFAMPATQLHQLGARRVIADDPLMPCRVAWSPLNLARSFLFSISTTSRQTPVRFLGDSLQCLRDFPVDPRQYGGYQLDKVQLGLQLDDFKPMPTIGKGVEDIRIRDDAGIYRVVYTARFADAVFVLRAFQKRTQRTSQRDIAIARDRFSEI